MVEQGRQFQEIYRLTQSWQAATLLKNMDT